MFENASQFTINNSTFNAAQRDINNHCQQVLYYNDVARNSIFHPDTLTTDEERKLHKWLGAPDTSINYITALNKKTPGTGSWILNHPIYIEWRMKGQACTLWIQGKGESECSKLFAYALNNIFTI